MAALLAATAAATAAAAAPPRTAFKPYLARAQPSGRGCERLGPPAQGEAAAGLWGRQQQQQQLQAEEERYHAALVCASPFAGVPGVATPAAAPPTPSEPVDALSPASTATQLLSPRSSSQLGVLSAVGVPAPQAGSGPLALPAGLSGSAPRGSLGRANPGFASLHSCSMHLPPASFMCQPAAWPAAANPVPSVPTPSAHGGDLVAQQQQQQQPGRGGAALLEVLLEECCKPAARAAGLTDGLVARFALAYYSQVTGSPGRNLPCKCTGWPCSGWPWPHIAVLEILMRARVRIAPAASRRPSASGGGGGSLLPARPAAGHLAPVCGAHPAAAVRGAVHCCTALHGGHPAAVHAAVGATGAPRQRCEPCKLPEGLKLRSQETQGMGADRVPTRQQLQARGHWQLSSGAPSDRCVARDAQRCRLSAYAGPPV